MNLHSLGPEPSASANSATSAYFASDFYTVMLTAAGILLFRSALKCFTMLSQEISNVNNF